MASLTWVVGQLLLPCVYFVPGQERKKEIEARIHVTCINMQVDYFRSDILARQTS